MRFSWIRWVIRYSLKDQIDLAWLVYSHSHDWKDHIHKAPHLLSLVAIVMILVWTGTVFAKNRQMTPYEKVLKVLRKRGITLSPYDSHEQHLDRIGRVCPALMQDFNVYLQDYLEWRFGGKGSYMITDTSKIIKKIRSMPRLKKPKGE